MSSPDFPQFVRCLKCKKILKCSVYDATCLLQHIREDHPEVQVVDNNNNNNHQSSRGTSKKSKNSISSGNASVDSCKKDNVLENIAQKTGLSHRKLSAMAGLAGLAGITKADLACAARMVNENQAQESPPALPESASKQSYTGKRSEGTSKYGTSESTVIFQSPSVEDTTQDSCAEDKCSQINCYRLSIEKWCTKEGLIYCPNCNCNLPPLTKTRAQVVLPCCSPCLLSCWPFCAMPCLSSNDKNVYLYCPNCQTFLGLYNEETHTIRPNKNFVECFQRHCVAAEGELEECGCKKNK